METLDIGTITNTGQTTHSWIISGNSTQDVAFDRTVSKGGIYPIYYGVTTGATRPAVTNDLVTGGTKIVSDSTGTVSVDFNSSAGEYSWLAIPSTSTSKTCWYNNDIDNGNINNLPSDKYPDECTISVTSGQGCWVAIDYKIYMSGSYGELDDPIQFRN